MEKTETAHTAQQPTLDDSQSELDEEEDDCFVGGTGEQSDKGQSGAESEGVDEEDDDDDEKEEAGPAAQPKEKDKDSFSRKRSIWGTTKYISKWKMAHRRGYHINCLTDDPYRKAMIMQQELDCKTSIPLPMVCMIEKETLQILQNIENDYKYKLGASHHLTKELHERIESLKCQVSSKVRHSDPAPEVGVLATLVGWCRALSAMLGWGSGASATKDEENALPRKERPLETDETTEL
ncbi:uncharacterized protein LOC121577653 [Coregonus clupeaformis]|uniref:uncharacterized protein LOC121577653 n=1 Tax=Coregonus clupeaformis TaxID=59861 RepID=UPI001E1C8B06|nr:uncharacterized protein LOC121577653 [Coregonus clupeaformis]